MCPFWRPNPRTSETVDQVYVGDNMGFIFGSSVSVSPDRTKVAVTYGYGTVVLDAQSHHTSLYERHGFVVDGPEFLDDGIPHTPMRRPSAP